MKKRVPDKFWFPWWPGKWIFGSVRIEFNPAERGIWVDLLSFASMDDGHIRANEETPYLLQQLAGMLIIPEKELDAAIRKFIKHKKLTKLKSGTLYVTKWEKYQFSDRHKRRMEGEMSTETDTKSGKKDAILNNNITNNNKLENTYIEEFNEFWELYNLKTAKKDSFKAFKALRRKKVSFETIKKAVIGYANHLKNERIHNKFDKKQKFPAGFLRNEYWKDFIGVEYKPPL